MSRRRRRPSPAEALLGVFAALVVMMIAPAQAQAAFAAAATASTPVSTATLAAPTNLANNEHCALTPSNAFNLDSINPSWTATATKNVSQAPAATSYDIQIYSHTSIAGITGPKTLVTTLHVTAPATSTTYTYYLGVLTYYTFSVRTVSYNWLSPYADSPGYTDCLL